MPPDAKDTIEGNAKNTFEGIEICFARHRRSRLLSHPTTASSTATMRAFLSANDGESVDVANYCFPEKLAGRPRAARGHHRRMVADRGALSRWMTNGERKALERAASGAQHNGRSRRSSISSRPGSGGDSAKSRTCTLRGRVLELAIIPSRNQFQCGFEQRAVADLGLVLQSLDQRLKERGLISRQQRLGEVHQEMELRIGERDHPRLMYRRLLSARLTVAVQQVSALSPAVCSVMLCEK